jgi:condensin complex subunit 1
VANLNRDLVEEGGIDPARGRNAVRMYAYLLQLVTVASEDEDLTAANIAGTTAKKGRSKKAKAKTEALGWDWAPQRLRCIKALQRLVDSITEALWPRRSPEPDLVNLLSRIAYKFLENPAVVKDADTKGLLFAALGAMVTQFKQSFGVSASVLHLLSHFEHLVAPLAEFVGDFAGRSVVTELLREIGRNDPAAFAQDAAGTRSIAAFLTDLGNRVPLEILKCGGISVLLPHLNGESYTIRNSILSILSAVVCELVRTATDAASLDATKATRQQFQDILEERIVDTSAYVRTRALQLWNQMAAIESVGADGTSSAASDEESMSTVRSAIPRARQPAILELSADRLMDKSCMVRKEALRLITTLMVRNPYGPHLDAAVWQAKADGLGKELGQAAAGILAQMTKKSEEKAAKKLKKGATGADDDGSEAATTDQGKGKGKGKQDGSETDDEEELLSDGDGDGDEEAEEEEEEEEEVAAADQTAEAGPIVTEADAEKMQALKLKFIFVTEGAQFSRALDKVVPCASNLLGSKNVTDVREAIIFIETASRYSIGSAEKAVQKMLALVWTKEEAVKAAVMEAYCRLFVTDRRSETIAKNLVNLTRGCNLGELTSLEALVCDLMAKEHLPSGVIKALWALFTGQGVESSESDVRVRALMVLGMCARSDPTIIKRNAGLLVATGLGGGGTAGSAGPRNMAMVQYTCIALQTLAPPDAKLGSSAERILFDASEPLFQRLIEAVAFQATDDVPGWHPAAEQAVNTIYAVAENPDKVCKQLVEALSVDVFGEAAAPPTAAQLARVVSVVGHVALKQLVHLERIEGEMKRRMRLQEDRQKQHDADKANKGQADDDGDDMIGGAAATDELAEHMATIAEHKLVGADSLLGSFGPVIESICKYRSQNFDNN